MSRTFAEPGQVAVALGASRISNGTGCYAGDTVPAGYESCPILQATQMRPQPPRKPLSAVAIDAAGLGTGVKDRKCSRLLWVEAGLIVGRLWLDMARGAEGVIRLESSANCVSAPRQDEAHYP